MTHAKLFFIVGVVISIFSLNGCAAYKAASQPPAKDLSVLNIGTERDYVRAELGAPVSTSEINGLDCETYSFMDGYTTGTRIARVTFHVAADFFSLFLWEAVGLPMEVAFSGNKHQERVCYKDGRVATVTNLKKD